MLGQRAHDAAVRKKCQRVTAIQAAHILEKHQILAMRAMEGFHGRSDSTEISLLA